MKRRGGEGLDIHEILQRFDGVKRCNESQYMASCPCHDDRKASLSVGKGQKGVVLKCQAGCDTRDIIARVGLKPRDLFYEQDKPQERPTITAVYTYPSGAQKLRYSDKHFGWRRPDGKGGWIWNRQDVPHTLYSAGEPDSTVYIVEGEKDADNLAKLGCFCVSGEDGAGHGKWLPEYTKQLQGRSALILPDNDRIGQDYAQEIAAALTGVAKSVRVLDLSSVWPEIPEKGDISDMIAALGTDQTCELLAQLERDTKEWEPPREPDVFDSFGFYTVPDLTEEERKPPEFIIEGMIPCGMTFLSGAPKIRKSFMAVQMAAAVATGQSFLGHKTTQCDVAYLDLEGSKSRISHRTDRMTTKLPGNVFITNSIEERLADGLVDKLRQLHHVRPGIRLIIIDTYSRSRGNYRASGANAYDADVAFLEPVQRMAIDENIAVLFVHHDKKGAGFSTDSFERLSGTMGISGSADAVLNLVAEGKRFDGKATLEYNPRDAKGGEISLVFDERFCEWQEVIDTAPDIRGDPVCEWIINNVPEKWTQGEFFPYDDVFRFAYNCYTENAGDKIRKTVEESKDELFSKFRIGVQVGVKSNGKRGIRIINLL